MDEIKRVLRCHKCGAILQDENPEEKGYINSEILNNHKSEVLMCNECFNKLIFKPGPVLDDIDEEFYSIIDDARATDSLIVLVLDLFSFEGFASERFKNSIDSSNVIVVGNKRDLLPKEIDDEILKEHIRHRLRKTCNLNVQEVILTSSIENYNIDVLLERIDILRKRHDVYILGFPNSGKTSLVNCLLKHYRNKTTRLISTIEYPGTKIRVFEVPLDRTSNLYDIPGMGSHNSILDVVEPSVVNQLLFQKPVSIKSTSLTQKSGIAFGGLARIDLLKGAKTNVKIFVSEKIELKTIRGRDSIDDVFYSMIKKKAIKPTSKYLSSYEVFDIYDVKIDQEGDRDIGILGLGWISFKGNNQTFRVSVPKGVYIYTSRAKVKLNAKK